MDAIFNYKRKQEEDYYFILGCDELSSAEQIQTEYKARALDLHPDKNQGDESAVEKFQLLQRAKDTLLDPEKRQEYDKWRRGGVAMPFDQWVNISKAAHTSMHWAEKKQKEPMLVGAADKSTETAKLEPRPRPTARASFSHVPSNPAGWQSESGSDLLKKFRNYEV